MDRVRIRAEDDFFPFESLFELSKCISSHPLVQVATSSYQTLPSVSRAMQGRSSQERGKPSQALEDRNNGLITNRETGATLRRTYEGYLAF